MDSLQVIMKAIPALRGGDSVRDVADACGVSYSTMCKYLRKYSIYKDGSLKHRLSYSEDFKSLLLRVASSFSSLDEASNFLGVSRDKLSSVFSSANVFIQWKLERNHNVLLASSRRAELFCKGLGYKVVRDCYTCKSASHVKAPYDLILEGWGSVDVKSSILKRDTKGNTYVAFNTQNFSKGVKYAFCVAMSEDREDFIAVFAIPGKLVFGHSTIHITLNPLSKKYGSMLIWRNETYNL